MPIKSGYKNSNKTPKVGDEVCYKFSYNTKFGYEVIKEFGYDNDNVEDLEVVFKVDKVTRDEHSFLLKLICASLDGDKFSFGYSYLKWASDVYLIKKSVIDPNQMCMFPEVV